MDAWLDEQSHSKTSKKKKKPEREANWLPQQDGNATVSEVFPKLCRVIMDDSKAELLCAYRRTNVFQPDSQEGRGRSPVCVGDRVLVEGVSKTDGIVAGVCERRNVLSRQAPGRDGNLYHEIAANIGSLVIVASVDEPLFSPGLVDRFLIAALSQEISVLIVVNKVDLLGEKQEKLWNIYLELGYDVLETSTHTQTGIAELRGRLAGKTSVFCGHSGVGKTSLLAALIGRAIGRTGEVNRMTGKGKHTTTSAHLIEVDSSTRWIDTPGVRAFSPVGIAPDELMGFFPELMAVQDEEARSRKPRYESYLRILESIEEK